MNEFEFITIQVPVALAKLMRRVDAMPDGRAVLTLTKEGGAVVDWSLVGAGKVERPVRQDFGANTQSNARGEPVYREPVYRELAEREQNHAD